MNIIEIYQLNKRGESLLALNECIKLLECQPNDPEVRICALKCAKYACESAADSCNPQQFIQAFRILPSLRIHELKPISNINRFAWNINLLLERLASNPYMQDHTASEILPILLQLPHQRPVKSYSRLLEGFLKVKGTSRHGWKDMQKFLDWWNLDNLLEEDFKKVHLEGAKTISSTAEKAFNAYYKTLCNDIDNHKINTARIEAFINRLNRLIDSNKNFHYTLYQKSMLLLAVRRNEEALKTLLPFAAAKQDEFWVWDALSKASDDLETKLSCACRALLCREDERFLGRVRLRAAVLMHQLGFDGNARTEIRILRDLYKHEGWHLPLNIISMVKSPWYQSATPSDSNQDFYRAHTTKAKELLLSDIPEITVLINYINPQKQRIGYITHNRQRGFISYRGLKQNLELHHIYVLRIAGSGDNQRLISASKVRDTSPFHNTLIRRVSGQVRVIGQRAYAFVEDVFIEASLLHDSIQHGSHVVANSVASFNQQKNSWSWKAISIELA